MNTTMIFVAGVLVFGLMLTGLFVSAAEFIKASDRPDLVKGRTSGADDGQSQ